MAPPMELRASVFDRLARSPFVVRQTLFGLGYILVPRRIPNLGPFAALALRDLLRVHHKALPRPEEALDRPDGLCGIARRVDLETLLEGYGRGLFLMSHLGPLKWWAPKQRMVLFFDQAQVEKTPRKLLRTQKFRFTFDTAFAEVMRACAAPRPGRPPLTWITPRMQALFREAHAAGHAHSVEVWEGDKLVGGVYGLAVGKVFFTESQFHTVRDASKAAFAVLNRHLQAWGFALNDGKHRTEYLAASGLRPISRYEFSTIAQAYSAEPNPVGIWALDPDLLDDRWNPAQDGGMSKRDLLPDGSVCDHAAYQSNTW